MKNMGKPNLGSQLKTSFRMNISRAGAQKAARHGEILSNNKMVSTKSGGHSPKNSGPKRGRRMY